MENQPFDYYNAVEGSTVFELTEISQRYLEEPTKLANGNAIVHRIKAPDLPEVPAAPSRRKRVATLGVGLLVLALVAGLAVPLALRLRASSLLEARLSFVRRILQEVPFLQGAGSNASDLAAGRLETVSVPCGAQYLDAVQLILEQLDEVKRAGEYIALDAATFKSSYQEGPVALLGVRGGHAIGDSLGVLRSLHGLGVRFLAPVHGCTTAWASSNGLSDFGELVIQEMNRLGIVVDLTGADENLAIDVMSVSTTPVIFSEAGSGVLCNSSIGISDFILSRLAANGGVALISLEQCGENDVERIIAHVDRVRAVAGLAHVGLAAGGDPALLLAELVRDRHWGTAAVKQLVGGNLLRALEEVEARSSLHNTALEEWMPLEDLDGNTYCRYPGI